MTIKAVFRVQCDGPCRGWLSEIGEVVAAYGSVTVRVIGHWRGERAARRAALGNGWQVSGRGRTQATNGHVHLLCPTCRLNPLGVSVPEAASCLGTHDTWAVCQECA